MASANVSTFNVYQSNVEMPDCIKVAIIGCGVAGLSSIKSCLDAGLRPTCFEQQSWLGGVWKYCEQTPSHVASVHNSTVTNTCKVTTCFSDFPFPMEFPNYLPHRYMQKYLEMYADHFGLEQYTQFNTVVEKLSRSNDHAQTGGWIVSHRKLGENKTRVDETFDAVMVCNGHFWDQVKPKIPGMEKFKGVQIHSGDYRTFHPFIGKRVVIVGGSHSAGDIASELSHHASQVYLSTRSGCYILQRLSANGLPYGMQSSRAASILPLQIKRKLVSGLLNNQYDMENFGLQPEGTLFVNRFPSVNDELHHRIITGSVIAKHDIKEVLESSVVFTDGSIVKDIDALVYATGFKLSYPFAEEIISVKHNYYVSLHKHIFLPEVDQHTLAIIGVISAGGPALPIMEMQARVAAEVFAGRCTLPSKTDMVKEIARREEQWKKIGAGENIFLRVSFGAYLDELAVMIGAKPNFWSIFKENPKLGLKFLFGPIVPAQYRLQGPNPCKDARKIILSTEKQYLYPLSTRKCPPSKSNSCISFLIFVLVALVAVIFVFFSKQ